MNLVYKNETLYVSIDTDFDLDMTLMAERRIFRIIDDYGIDKVVINVLGRVDRKAVNQFKKDYYHKYRGYLTIK